MIEKKIMVALSYDKDSGKFVWKNSKLKYMNGKTAGSLYKNGYIAISFQKKRYYAHRLAWLFTHKKWPEKSIDHINGIKTDNRIINLRDISKRENCSNQFRHRKGKLIGAHFDKHSRGPSKWKTRIQIDGKIIHVGSSKTEKEAHDKYVNFKNERGLK